MLLRLASSLVTVVSEVIRLKFEFRRFLNFYIWPLVSVLLYLILLYVLYGLVLFPKGDFCGVNVPRMIFKGGILCGTRNFHCNLPYRLITIFTHALVK